MKRPSMPAMVRLFRVLAIAEGFSWGALLIGMFLKWVTRTTELGVEIAGPIHGAFFIGYGIAALGLWGLQRWPFRVALFAGLAAVLPFATVWFERWAGRHGYLAVTTGQGAAAPAWESADETAGV
jgi:integral membrane protein